MSSDAVAPTPSSNAINGNSASTSHSNDEYASGASTPINEDDSKPFSTQSNTDDPLATPINLPKKRGRPPKSTVVSQANSPVPAPAPTPTIPIPQHQQQSPVQNVMVVNASNRADKLVSNDIAVDSKNGGIQVDPTASSSNSASNLLPPVSAPIDPFEGITLNDDERRKLLVVLQKMDPADILSQSLFSDNGASSLTLSRIVSDPTSTIPFLRTNINTACTTSLVSSLSAPTSTHSAIESFRSLALSLVSEIGRKRKRPAMTTMNDESGTVNVARPTKKFMLHRSLGGMDLFSSATALSDEDLKSVRTLPDTDVISVLSAPASSTSSIRPIPTLGTLNPRPLHPIRNLSHPSKPNPIQMLYYDPFQSFAPTHDSTSATIDYRSSISYLSSRTLVADWEKELIEARDGNSLGMITNAEIDVLKDVLESQEWKNVVDAVEIDPELRNDDKEEEGEKEGGGIEDRLEMNKALLEKLIKAQLGRSLLPPSIEMINSQGNEVTLLAGKAEDQTAEKLVKSLTTLIQSISPSSSTSSKNRKIFPSITELRQATPRILQRLSKDKNYQGTLDPFNWRALKEEDLIKVEQQPQKDESGNLEGGK